MAVNIELLQKTLGAIKDNPQHWNQKYWHCRTSHCFAGFAELIAHNIPINTSAHQIDELRSNNKLIMGSTPFVAEKLLGISDEDGCVLFHGYNTLEQLERMVLHLIEYGSLEDYIIRPDDCEADADDQ
jgi:hypothetical protein